MSLRTFLGILESTSGEWFAMRAGQSSADGQTLEAELFTVLAMEKGKLAREIRAGAAVIEIDARDLAVARRDRTRLTEITRTTGHEATLPWAVGQPGQILHGGQTISDALDCASVCSLIAAVDSERRD